MKRLIYADNAATTKLDIEAFEVMKSYLLNEYGNASQPYSFARAPKKALKEARKIIASCINAEEDEIYFTSGGTESNNWALKGVSLLGEKDTVITSKIEHHAILNVCKVIESLCVPVKYLDVTDKGTVTTSVLESIITNKTKLVSIMYVNNEIGTVQPIKRLVEVAHKYGALFHTDAIQAVGHINIDVKELGVDLLSASAHKFNGPKGVGFLYIKRGTPIHSYQEGGGQERFMRAGTENVAAIIAMAIALKNNCDKLSENCKYIINLENKFISLLKESKINFIRNGENTLPGNISLSFKDMDGESILHRLDLAGICVSTGAACDTIKTKVSHVLEAINLDKRYAKGTVRVSLFKDNTEEEVDIIAENLIKIVNYNK